ncbi:MAG: hypothetical protein Q9166_003937 [cf. Caloplaca sp. 2 TL-2023]
MTAGYRPVFTYNLTRTTGSGPMTATTIIRERADLQKVLQIWKKSHEAGQSTINKLVYILDNKYSEPKIRSEDPDLRFALLKGRDGLLGRYLQDASKLEGFTLLLANSDRTINGAEDDSEHDFEDHPGEMRLRNLKDQHGRETIDSAELSGKEIIQLDPFNREPDDINKPEGDRHGWEPEDATHTYSNVRGSFPFIHGQD